MLKPILREDDVQAFVEARYEYHWTPLVGCLVAQLGHIGITQPGYVIGATTGIYYQSPRTSALPADLSAALSALGVAPTIVDRTQPRRLQRLLVRRRIRRELRADRPVTVYGVGVSAFGPPWGRIGGCDDQRSAWRRDGPMTEQVSPWLPESEFSASVRLARLAARWVRETETDALAALASDALAGAVDRVGHDFMDRIGLLDSAIEIEPQQHAHDAQALAASWGEVAAFWREFRHVDYTPVAQQLAITLSRYATLFPYPMGGQPNNPGVRTAAVHILREAVDVLAASH